MIPRVDARLAAAGLGSTDAAAKVPLFDAAATALHDALPKGPPAAWWVPGRLEVFGKHTDYAGGRSLVAAVPRGFAVVAALADGDAVRAIDARHGEDMIALPGGPAFTGWRRYVQVVVERLARNFPATRRGCMIAFAGDLPRASGMSSSSALVVGVATALSGLWDLRARPEWRRTLRSPEDVASYFASLENGSSFGPLDGDAGVGTQGGSEDHAAIVLGRADHLTAWSFVPMRRMADVARPADWCFVLGASGVASEKTGRARNAYNRLSAGVRRVHALWNVHETPAVSLAEALRAGTPTLEQMRSLVRTSPAGDGWTAVDLLRRLEHFVLEDGMVAEALRAFASADRDTLGALASASQEAADRLLGNQVPETIALARLARESGAFAASSFGAGFGGSVWALTDAASAPAFAVEWLERYRAAFPDAGANAQVFIARPGPGVVQVL